MFLKGLRQNTTRTDCFVETQTHLHTAGSHAPAVVSKAHYLDIDQLLCRLPFSLFHLFLLILEHSDPASKHVIAKNGEIDTVITRAQEAGDF